MASPPKMSKTKDTFTHHSSPNSGPQQPPVVQKPPARTVTGTIKTPQMPRYTVKHSNPVGRPKSPRY